MDIYIYYKHIILYIYIYSIHIMSDISPSQLSCESSFFSVLLSCHPSGVALSYSSQHWGDMIGNMHPESSWYILTYWFPLIPHDDHDATEVPVNPTGNRRQKEDNGWKWNYPRRMGEFHWSLKLQWGQAIHIYIYMYIYMYIWIKIKVYGHPTQVFTIQNTWFAKRT